MIKKNLATVVAIGLALTMTFGPLSAKAESANKASVGSVAGDIDAGAEPTGVDETQEKKSEYYDEFTADALDQGCEVYATLPSSFTVKIPKTVILTGAANGSGSYTVKVSGDIAGDETITVKPDASVAMQQSGKTDVTATISQTKTTWTVADTGLVDGLSTTGTITADGLTAGQWKGSFNFDISLSKN